MANLRGSLLVGQSGGPTAVINQSLVGVVHESTEQEAIETTLGMVHGIEGALNEDFVDLRRESNTTLDRLLATPASALGSCRYKLGPHDLERLLQVLMAHDVRYFIYIGGNDSMDTCLKLARLAEQESYEFRVMGVPKTIDNDLAETDHCPGYGSAARFVALATMDVGRDLESMSTFDDVVILETMGRNSGWIAAASILGKAHPHDSPHLVYVPERPFSDEAFLEQVQRVHAELNRVFVVVCEGIRYSDGTLVGQAASGDRRDEFGHQLTAISHGAASYLSDLAAGTLGLQARFLRPGILGRALLTCVSATDQEEAYRVGRTAVRHAATGNSGKMVTLLRDPSTNYRCQTGLTDLSNVAEVERVLPQEFIQVSGSYITDAFRDYALPLLGDPLPVYGHLSGHKVPKRSR